MRGDLKLFKIFGIDVKLHISWWFILIFLSWVLSTGFFPNFYPGLSSFQYFVIGLSAALMLFFSVLLHEFAHSLIAKNENIKVEEITLFFFGGVSGISDENLKPKSEFIMSIAGPIFSLVLAFVFFVIFSTSSNIFLNALTFYLYQLNLMLGVFNLVPAFPLDGGRIFRSILYWLIGDLKKATAIAALVGKLFAWVLGLIGFLYVLKGIYSGFWLIFLSIFLYSMAGLSYEQVVIREILLKWKVKDLMDKNIELVNGKDNVYTFLNKKRRSLKEVYVVYEGKTKIIGLLFLDEVGAMSQKVQKNILVRQLAYPNSHDVGVYEDRSVYSAFKILNKESLHSLPVFRRNMVGSKRKGQGKSRKKLIGFLKNNQIFDAIELKEKFNV